MWSREQIDQAFPVFLVLYNVETIGRPGYKAKSDKYKVELCVTHADVTGVNMCV